MLCGWGEQCYQMHTRHDHCSQEVYQNLVDTYDEVGIDWDILTIDDFWGKERGIWRVNEDTWPDMRGFIDAQHARNRHVLLWVCPYPDGLPDDELYIVGKQKLLDPSNPKYLRRLEENLRHMLSDEEGCLNADGMKLDFTGGVPNYGEEQCAAPLHGMCYLYEFFKMIHDIAKKIKPDCLLDFQLANPHFASFHDMVRLNDCKVTLGMALKTYQNRAYIGKSAAKILSPIKQPISNFTASVAKMNLLTDQERIVFDENPITPWCFSNAVLAEDNNGNCKPMKRTTDSPQKIDGAITNLMCLNLFAELGV
jgi:hypothetical protein